MRRKRWKDFIAIASIIVLLPYVITVLMSGVFEGKDSELVLSGEIVRLEENGIVRELDREQYLIEVLAAQMPVDYEEEALKAQAVLARTFFLKSAMAGTTVKKEEAKQEYRGMVQMETLWEEEFQNNYTRLEDAVKTTGNERIVCNGELIEPSFHAVSAGTTRNGEEIFGENVYPYLKSRASEKDKEAPEYLTVLTLDKEKLEAIVRENYGEEAVSSVAVSPAAAFVIQERDSTGYVIKIQAAGQVIGGEQFRSQFSLPSSCFDIEELEGELRIICKGLGHGFGMSLYGANELAKEGKNYREILQYYFENIEIVSE